MKQLEPFHIFAIKAFIKHNTTLKDEDWNSILKLWLKHNMICNRILTWIFGFFAFTFVSLSFLTGVFFTQTDNMWNLLYLAILGIITSFSLIKLYRINHTLGEYKAENKFIRYLASNKSDFCKWISNTLAEIEKKENAKNE